MAGYAVSGRIDTVAPRRVQPSSARGDAPGLDDDGTVDPDGLLLEPDLGDRLEMIRERWSQLTFFLFDADSWRT